MKPSKILPLALSRPTAPPAPVATSGAEALTNPQRERFCLLVVAGRNPTEAYREVYQATKPGAIWAASSTLMRNELVVQRIKWLRAQVLDETLMLLKERRQYLARVVRTPIGQVDEDSDLCENYTNTITTNAAGTTTESTKIVMPGKLEAIKLDSQLAGDLTEKPEGSGAPPADLQMIVNVVNQFISGSLPAQPVLEAEAEVVS